MSATVFIEEILNQFYRAEQVDLLHLALTNLLEMIDKNEIDVFLDQREKSAAQKKAFIQKIVAAVESPELKQALQGKLAAGETDFFRERNLENTLLTLQKAAEQVEMIKLTLAVNFKEPELREMVALLEEQLHNKVVLELSIEHGLMGGAIVQHGSAIRDYSLRTRLETFRDHWKKAVVEA